MSNFMNAETALLLLELDESLHSLKDRNGITGSKRKIRENI